MFFIKDDPSCCCLSLCEQVGLPSIGYLMLMMNGKRLISCNPLFAGDEFL